MDNEEITRSPAAALTTYYDRPVLKQPVWIWTVPAYFYAGGLAGAALVLSAAIQTGGSDELRPMVRTTRWIGCVGQIAGSILLIADLGRPSRFLHMLRVFRKSSPLSVGSWVLAAGGSLSGVAAMLPDRWRGARLAGDAAGIGAGLLGLPLAGYTGVLLCNTAVPVWNNARRSLPALFVASSVASCASFLELLPLSRREAAMVQRFGAIGKIAELGAVLGLEREVSKNVHAAAALRSGVPVVLWTASKVLTAASLMLTLMPGQTRTRRAAGLLGTLGGVALRFAVYRAGVNSAQEARP